VLKKPCLVLIDSKNFIKIILGKILNYLVYTQVDGPTLFIFLKSSISLWKQERWVKLLVILHLETVILELLHLSRLFSEAIALPIKSFIVLIPSFYNKVGVNANINCDDEINIYKKICLIIDSFKYANPDLKFKLLSTIWLYLFNKNLWGYKFLIKFVSAF
jgi:hypothetical protein